MNRAATVLVMIVLQLAVAGCQGEASSGRTGASDAAELDASRTDARDASRQDAETSDVSSSDALDSAGDASSPPESGHGFDLRADPDFASANLAPEVRLWWERMRSSISHPDRYPDERLFEGGDLYQYARPTHTYLQALLLSLRATGDARFLDEATRVLDLMRDQLRDEWHDTLDGSDGTTDGYLNWTYQGSRSDEYHTGKDLHSSNEIKTHAIVFQVLAALEANRDVESPAGWSYAEEADFWQDYLFNHFVPKWEERDNDGGYDGALIHRPHTHTSISNIKLHYYLWRFGGDQGRLAYAETLADIFTSDELNQVDSAYGPAYVWPRSFHSILDRGDYLHPTTYARYVVADVAHFTLIGFDVWQDQGEAPKYARPLAAFVFDDPPDSYASSIGGDQDRGGYWHNSDFDRQSASKFGSSPYTHILAWDDTGELEERFLAYMEARDDLDAHYAAIPMGGLLFNAAWKHAN